ncbi:MAG: cellulose 1,4-beta-cellobiosidase, partial [Acidimicrobiales bacterium]
MARRDRFRFTAVLLAVALIMAACSDSGGGEAEGSGGAVPSGGTGADEVVSEGTVLPVPPQ